MLLILSSFSCICLWGQGRNSWSKASGVIFRPGFYLNFCCRCRFALSRNLTLNRSPWAAFSNSLSVCRRVHNRSQTPHRSAPPAFPPIPLLQQLAPCCGGLCIQGSGPAHGEQCHCAVYGCQNPTVRGHIGVGAGAALLGVSCL